MGSEDCAPARLAGATSCSPPAHPRTDPPPAPSFIQRFPRPDPVTGAFHFEQGSNWILENDALFAGAAVAYLPLLWLLGRVMERREKGFDLKAPLIVWNLGLAAFSLMGAYQIIPLVVRRALDGQPIMTTLCDASIWHQPSSYWLFLFVASKLPELVDTMFLRLRKRPVIFLHWYHHIVTLLWCWYTARHSWRISSSVRSVAPLALPRPSLTSVLVPQILYVGATMNYFVHSIMYTYYALAAMGFGRTMAKMRINLLLTSSQILQMVVGLYVAVVSARCPGNVDDLGFYSGLAMYASYFVLFAKVRLRPHHAYPRFLFTLGPSPDHQLFVDKYMGGGAAKPQKKTQ